MTDSAKTGEVAIATKIAPNPGLLRIYGAKPIIAVSGSYVAVEFPAGAQIDVVQYKE